MKIIRISQIQDIAILKDPNTPVNALQNYLKYPESMFLTQTKIDLILKHPNCTMEMLKQIEKTKRTQENLKKEEILYQHLQRQFKQEKEKKEKFENSFLNQKERKLKYQEKQKLLEETQKKLEKELLKRNIQLKEPYTLQELRQNLISQLKNEKEIKKQNYYINAIKNILTKEYDYNHYQYPVESYDKFIDKVNKLIDINNPEGLKIINHIGHLRGKKQSMEKTMFAEQQKIWLAEHKINNKYRELYKNRFATYRLEEPFNYNIGLSNFKFPTNKSADYRLYAKLEEERKEKIAPYEQMEQKIRNDLDKSINLIQSNKNKYLDDIYKKILRELKLIK